MNKYKDGAAQKQSWFKKTWTVGLIVGVMWVCPQVLAATAQSVPVHHGQQATGSTAYEDPLIEMESGLFQWNPWSEMARMQEGMGRLSRLGFFGPQLFESGYARGIGIEPRLEVENQPSNYLIKVDLPGMEKEKLNVSVRNGYLAISGERRYVREEKKEGQVQWSERQYGSFTRTLPLPENVKTEEVTAKYENGVLTITLPKIHPETVKTEEVKKIPIQ